MRNAIMVAAALLSTGCGGAAALVLKDPIVDKCTSAGVQGCPDLTDGVLLFIDGKTDEGREKVITGAAANSPEQLRDFAVVLQQVGKIPGAESYMGPVLEVAKLIVEQADKRGGGKSKGRKVKPSDSEDASAEAPAAAPPPVAAVPVAERASTVQIPSRWKTADTDLMQIETGIAAPALSPSKVSCDAPFDLGAAWCVAPIKGPFVITDIWAGPGCQADLFVAAGAAESRSWSVASSTLVPLTMHGGRLMVHTGESLILGVHGKGSSEPHCAITWSGFRPYPPMNGAP